MCKWFVAFIYIRWFSTLLCIHGDMNNPNEKIHKNWSPTNSDTSAVTEFLSFFSPANHGCCSTSCQVQVANTFCNAAQECKQNAFCEYPFIIRFYILMPSFLFYDTLNDLYKGYTCILVCIVHKYNVISNTVICNMPWVWFWNIWPWPLNWFQSDLPSWS